MAARSATSTALIVCLLIFTFPLWIGIGAGFFGLIVGLFGAVFGIIAGIFGAIVWIIVLPFKLILGWGWFPHVHFTGFLIVAVIVMSMLLIMKKK